MGVYSSIQIAFVIIAIVNSAARSFLKRTHGRTHVPTPGKLTYRGGTGPPKNIIGHLLVLGENKDFWARTFCTSQEYIK